MIRTRLEIRDGKLKNYPTGCEECKEHNTPEFLKQELCPGCIWEQQTKTAEIYRLLDIMELQDAGCPIGRHELTNQEWRGLGILRREREFCNIPKLETIG